MLLAKITIDEVREIVTAGDFYKPAHATIFSTILALYDRGEPADPITVAAAMLDSGDLKRVGGVEYLHTVVNAVPTAANAAYYARIVAEKAVMRRLTEAGTRITQLGYGAGAAAGRELGEILDLARQSLDAIETQGGRGGVDVERAGWLAVDLTDVIDGTEEILKPELGRRQDGIPLLYCGKEHSIASEPECGKTWFAVMQVGDVLQRGGKVLYIDFEDDARTIVGRIKSIGLLTSRLKPEAGQFRYVRPEGRYHDTWLVELLDFGGNRHVDLVVLDGVTEGMALFGLDPLKQGDAATWRQVLIKPALNVGAATLATDHLVKDKENRGGYAIGAQHKLAGLNGVQFLLEQVNPFGRGLKGRSKVLVSKDRNGWLRQHGQPTDKPRITYLGDLVGDATSGEMESLIFWPPREEEPSEENGDIPRHVLPHIPKIVKALQSPDAPLGSNAILRRVGGKRDDVLKALDWMVDSGHVRIESGRNRSKLHALIKDPSEELNEGNDQDN